MAYRDLSSRSRKDGVGSTIVGVVSAPSWGRSRRRCEEIDVEELGLFESQGESVGEGSWIRRLRVRGVTLSDLCDERGVGLHDADDAAGFDGTHHLREGRGGIGDMVQGPQNEHRVKSVVCIGHLLGVEGLVHDPVHHAGLLGVFPPRLLGVLGVIPGGLTDDKTIKSFMPGFGHLLKYEWVGVGGQVGRNGSLKGCEGRRLGSGLRWRT